MRIVFSARIALQRKIAWLLLFSFFSLCFIGWLIYFNKKNTETSTYWINHTYGVIQHIDKINTRIATWESLSRPPQNAAFHLALKKDLERIRKFTVDNADQQQLIDRLSMAIDSLGTGADTTSLMSLKSMLGDMMQHEKDLLLTRRTFSKASEAKNTWLLIGASILVFLFISIILIRLNRDIVLRRRAEGKLTENQSWLQSILDNSTSVIYIKDPAGRYVMVNRRFREILEVQEETVIGHTDADFSTVEAAAHYRFLDEQVVHTGKSLEIEEVIPTAGGDVYLLSIKFPLLDGEGRLIGIGGIATDITERVQYQQQLIAATREAQSAKGMQELFLANMSHEIRTPMNGIQGMTDLLLDTQLTDQQKEFARIIKRSVNNLLVVVNDVLDFSKIKAGKLAIEKIEFRLKDVLDNVRAMFAHRNSKKGAPAAGRHRLHHPRNAQRRPLPAEPGPHQPGGQCDQVYGEGMDQDAGDGPGTYRCTGQADLFRCRLGHRYPGSEPAPYLRPFFTGRSGHLPALWWDRTWPGHLSSAPAITGRGHHGPQPGERGKRLLFPADVWL